MIKDIYKNLAKKAILKFEYNNIGVSKKEIYFTNNNLAIDFLLQDKTVLNLPIPTETENSIVGFDVKEKRFIKCYLSLIHSAGLPYLEDYNPAYIEKNNLSLEDQTKILNAQKEILDNTVFKKESSKIYIDPVNTKYCTNVENALKVLGISDLHLNSKNPKIVGKCKRAWLEKIIEHKEKIVNYLNYDKNNSKEIEEIISKLEAYDYRKPLFNLHTPLDIIQYWPDILNPKPDFIVSSNLDLLDSEYKRLYLDRILETLAQDFKFYKYNIYGTINGEFNQSEKAIAIKKDGNALHYFSFPLDRNTLSSGEYGISNIYFVNNLTFINFKDNDYIFETNNLGLKAYDWELTLINDDELTIKSNLDNFEFKALKAEPIADPYSLLKETIVFEK